MKGALVRFHQLVKDTCNICSNDTHLNKQPHGVTPKLMQAFALLDLKLDVIDHQSCHSRFEHT